MVYVIPSSGLFDLCIEHFIVTTPISKKNNSRVHHDFQDTVITALALYIVFSCLQVAEADSHGNQTASYEYGIILDGGSSGTKLKIYRWKQVTASFIGSVLDVEQIESIKFEPGISEYAARLDDLPKYLFDITNRAEELVPTGQQWRTPIYFMATAGKTNGMWIDVTV